METDLRCNACQFMVTSPEQRSQHYKSEWHRYNVKRRCAGLGSIPQDLFEQKLSALEEKKKQSNPDRAKAKCTLCNKFFQSDAAFKQHLNTKSHLKKEKKPSMQTSTAVSSAAPSEPRSPLPVTRTESKAAADAAVDEEDEEDDGAGVLDDAESLSSPDGEKKKGPLREPIPLGTCLFCSKRFGNDLEKQLNHMLKYHGFFIPFIEYLEDVEGFLEYLGAKIGEGNICLYCNGRGRANYPSLHATQEHMRAKSHCKIRFDEEEDQEEYLDFFNFPGEIGQAIDEGEGEEDEEEEEEGEEEDAKPAKGKSKGGKPISKDEVAAALAAMDEGEGDEEEDEETRQRNAQLIALDGIQKKRHLAGMNDLGELVLSDGSVLGHRGLKVAYKQHVRTPETRDSVLIARMQSAYKQLAAPGYTPKSKMSERTLIINKLHQKQMMKRGIAFNSYGRLRRVSQNS